MTLNKKLHRFVIVVKTVIRHDRFCYPMLASAPNTFTLPSQTFLKDSHITHRRYAMLKLACQIYVCVLCSTHRSISARIGSVRKHEWNYTSFHMEMRWWTHKRFRAFANFTFYLRVLAHAFLFANIQVYIYRMRITICSVCKGVRSHTKAPILSTTVQYEIVVWWWWTFPGSRQK